MKTKKYREYLTSQLIKKIFSSNKSLLKNKVYIDKDTIRLNLLNHNLLKILKRDCDTKKDYNS